MKTTAIILTFFLILSSCYSYRSFDAEEYIKELEEGNNTKSSSSPKKISRNEMSNVRRGNVNTLKEEEEEEEEEIAKEKIKAEQNNSPKIDLSKIKHTDIIKENNFYKVKVLDKEYTIEAKQWKADTLYAIVKGKPNKELKFHQNEIALSDVKIRKFSKGKSDALTVAAYALGGVGLFLLLK